MRLFRSFKTQCIKILSDPMIIVCSFMVTALCCLTDVFSEPNGGKEYSVLTMLLSENSSEFTVGNGANCIFCENVIRSGFSGWLVMFAPIICVLPFAKNLSNEKTSYKRFEVMRCGKNAFTLSRFAAGALSSGLILSAGYGIFMLLSTALFPSALSIGGNMVRIALRGMSVPGFFLSRLAGAFWVGVVCFLPAYWVSLLSGNKYMVVCIPFMLLHFYSLIIEKIIDDRTSDAKKFLQLFLVNGIFKAFENQFVLYEILILCLLVLISVILGITAVHKRIDCCE